MINLFSVALARPPTRMKFARPLFATMPAQLTKLDALTALGDVEGSILACYNALVNATTTSKGVTLADLLNAWLACMNEMDDPYCHAVMKACTHMLLAKCLTKIGASDDHIAHVRTIARQTWENA